VNLGDLRCLLLTWTILIRLLSVVMFGQRVALPSEHRLLDDWFDLGLFDLLHTVHLLGVDAACGEAIGFEAADRE